MTAKWLIGVVAIASIGASPFLRSQSAGDSRDATILALGSATGPPGGKVSLSLALTAAPGVNVGEFEAIVTVPSSQLSFVTAETGGLSDGVGAEMTTETAAGGRDGTSQIRLRLSTLVGQATRQPLPNGVLVYLMFAVAKEIGADTVVSVDAAGSAQTIDDPPKAVEPLTVKGASVTVGDVPVTSCFFYMH